MDCAGVADQSIESLEHAPPICVKLVKGTRARKHFKWPFSNPFEVHTTGKIEKGDKVLFNTFRFAGGDDQFHRVYAHVLQRPKRIDKRAIFHAKGRLRPVHTGWDIGQRKLFFHFFKIYGELIGEVDIAIHDTGHEFHWMIGLEPSSLIAHHRIGRSM